MFFFLLSIIMRGIRHSSLERSATKVPKKRKKATKRHQDTVRWVLHYTNQTRKEHKLVPFTRYITLESAAQKHSNWMERKGVCDHIGSGGSDPRERMKLEGFLGDLTAENCYQYPARRDHKNLAKNLVDGWMKSPGHRSNILHPQLKYLGEYLGVGITSDGKHVYATQNFGG